MIALRRKLNAVKTRTHNKDMVWPSQPQTVIHSQVSPTRMSAAASPRCCPFLPWAHRHCPLSGATCTSLWGLCLALDTQFLLSTHCLATPYLPYYISVFSSVFSPSIFYFFFPSTFWHPAKRFSWPSRTKMQLTAFTAQHSALSFILGFLPTKFDGFNFHNYIKFGSSSSHKDRHSNTNRCLPSNASQCFDIEFW